MDFEHYRELLEAEKQKVTSELNSVAVPNRQNQEDWDAVREENPGSSDSSDEVAEELEDLNERKAAERTLEDRLKKIEMALSKIADGTFGRCEICAQKIETDRLEADPSSRVCKKDIGQEDILPLF